MAFRIHLLFIYTTLVLLSLYNINAFNAEEWLKSKFPSLDFTWENCGPATDPLQLKTLTVGPDPILVPGNLTIGFVASLASPIPTDVRLTVVMEKKIGGFYVKIPCIDDFGSCNYGNLCEQWADACPKHFEKYGIPCTCPIPANTYSVSDVIVQINGKLPSVGDGTYRITGDAASAAGHLGCLKLEITLKGA